MEPILTYLKRKLKDAGPPRWSAIAAETGCSVHTMRKVAYNDIENPGVVTMQPLMDLFQAVDRGERELPEPLPARLNESEQAAPATAEQG